MASRLEEDLCCSLCLQVFSEPVLLSCSHSFCQACVRTWWTQRPSPDCPVCRAPSAPEPPRNLALKNLCETFSRDRAQGSSKDLCELHSEKLRLFCLDHQQPVCVVCRDSERHLGHGFRPLDEAAQGSRRNLQETLEHLKEKSHHFEEQQVAFDQTADRIQVQARHAESQVREVFKKLRGFLEEEEESRVVALRKEEEQKCRAVKEKMEVLSTEAAALANAIGVAERELRAEDVHFLLRYKTTLEQVQQPLLLVPPRLDSWPLIDEAKHLNQLIFQVCDQMQMKVSYNPEPLESGPGLSEPQDLSDVMRQLEEMLPGNGGRMTEEFLWSPLQLRRRQEPPPRGFGCGPCSRPPPPPSRYRRGPVTLPLRLPTEARHRTVQKTEIYPRPILNRIKRFEFE